jgi:GNAT superfamily N-acetyltransferase
VKISRSLSVKELNSDCWADFEDLFGRKQGANGGCWCMWWRLPRSQWQNLGKEGRRAAFKRTVESGRPTGVLLIEDGKAVGWCAVAPRNEYPTLSRSSVAKPIDETPSWCVSCFFIKAGHRRKGYMELLIRGAIWFARKRGAAALDAFPQDVDAREGFVDTFVGIASTFKACGFEEIERRGKWRPAMRLDLRSKSGKKRRS